MHLIILVILLFVAIALALAFQIKNRLIWQELFQLRDQFNSLQNEIVSCRKQIIIEQVGNNLRLPASMPSQNGEDILIFNFFDRKHIGFYIEIGAYNGVAFSNTYFFEALGWTGILVEPIPEYYEACLTSRPNSNVIHGAIGKEQKGDKTLFSVVKGDDGVSSLSFLREQSAHLERVHREGGIIHKIEVPVYSLDDLLEQHRGDIDFISIDVEGSEMEVLQTLDLNKFHPRVFVIEDNSAGKDTVVSDRLALYGYIERFRCKQNVFYTHKTDSKRFQW